MVNSFPPLSQIIYSDEVAASECEKNIGLSVTKPAFTSCFLCVPLCVYGEVM